MAELAASANADAGKLDVSRVVNRTFALLGGNFPRFAIFAFFLSLIPSAIAQAILSVLTIEPVMDFAGLAGVRAYMRVTVALSQIPAYAGFGAIYLCSMAWFDGRGANFGTCLSRGASAYGPLFLLNLVAFMALGVGLLLLIAPGAFLATIIVVAGPAMAMERLGLLDSFRRSAHLTHGNRWRILLIFIICGMADWAHSRVTGFVTQSISSALGGPPQATPTMIYVGIATSTVFNTLKLMLIGAGLAALYIELRTLKDGGPREELAKVFD